MDSRTLIDKPRLDALEARENARFVAEHPRSMALLERSHRTMPRGVPMSWMDDLYEHPPVFVEGGKGAYFTDIEGHTFLDMYLADMSAFCVSIAHTAADVDQYVDLFGRCLSDLVASDAASA